MHRSLFGFALLFALTAAATADGPKILACKNIFTFDVHAEKNLSADKLGAILETKEGGGQQQEEVVFSKAELEQLRVGTQGLEKVHHGHHFMAQEEQIKAQNALLLAEKEPHKRQKAKEHLAGLVRTYVAHFNKVKKYCEELIAKHGGH